MGVRWSGVAQRGPACWALEGTPLLTARWGEDLHSRRVPARPPGQGKREIQIDSKGSIYRI